MASRKIFSLFGSIAIEGMAANKAGLKAFDKEALKITKSLNKMGRQATKLGKTLTKNITVPILAAAAAAVKFGGDFEQAMTNSIAIMGDVSKATRTELEHTAREVAKTTIFSATEAAEAYYFLASAGLTAAESMEALPRVAAFAQAGNFDLAKATDLLTDAQSALGLSSDDTAEHMENTARVSDVLVKAAQNANATVAQFSEGLTNKAGVALELLNKDIEEGVAVMQVYADKGLAKGADAGTQLNIVLRDLQMAALNNKKAFKEAGIEVFDADEKMRHIADVIGDMEGRLLGMSDEGRRAELMMLGFTSKSIDATSALLGTSDQIKEYEKALKSAAGTTDEVAKKQLNSFWAQMGLIKDRLIDVGLTLYETLGPILMRTVVPMLYTLIEKLSALASWFDNLSDPMKESIVIIIGVVAVAGPMLLLFVKFLPVIKSMILLYKVLAAGQMTLNIAMSANVIGLITIAIVGLIAAGVLLFKNWDTVKKVSIQVWNSLKSTVESVVISIMQGFTEMVATVLDGLAKLTAFVPGFGKAIEGAAESVRAQANALEEMNVELMLANKSIDINSKLTAAQKAIVEQAEKVVKKYKKSIKQGVADKEADVKATKAQMKAEKELSEEREQFAKDWESKLFELTATRLELLEKERQEAVKKAGELGVETNNINDFFAMERIRAERNASEEVKKIKKQESEAIKAERRKVFDFTVGIINQVNNLWSSSIQLRMAQLDEQTASEIERIQNSTMAETDKEAAIAKLNEEADKKKLELQKENARREKAAAIFSIILSTAMAVTKALSMGMPVGLIFAAIVGALGIAQIAIAASQPVPFAEGGLVKSSPGTGIVAQIGEGKEDELVLPMKTGAAELANNIIGKLDTRTQSPVMRMGNTSNQEVHTHLHIGTLIADAVGLKNLERKLRTYRVGEGQRTGNATA